MRTREGPGQEALDHRLADAYPGGAYTFYAADEEIQRLTRGLFAGVRVHRATGPAPHWHYVTYAFSDLGEKESPDPDLSGWGFELTCRVPARDADDEAPEWPVAVLAHLACYVFESRGPRWFEEGHSFDLQAPADGAGPLTALVFAADPLLPPLATVNGRVEFLQAVGIHPDELAALRSWQAAAFLDLLRDRDPILLTDPARPSLLADPASAQRIHDGIERDGSSFALVGDLGWVLLGREPRVEVQIASGCAAQIREALPRMLPRGQNLVCMGNLEHTNSVLVFTPGGESAWFVDEGENTRALVIQLPPDLIEAFVERLTTPATLEWPGLANLKLQITP